MAEPAERSALFPGEGFKIVRQFSQRFGECTLRLLRHLDRTTQTPDRYVGRLDQRQNLIGLRRQRRVNVVKDRPRSGRR